MSVSVAKLFGLEGDGWMRHANPVSVWTRFAVLPLLALAIWSREWIGWWSLAAVALALVFMMVNPLLFPPARSTRNWASKGVLGERIWSDRSKVELDLLAVVAGLLVTQAAKAWFIDRMVLLSDDMKARVPEYAAWDY
ncbi:MAG TPA: DUF6653 family protein [Actinomycetes bacterium]|nr:DUF6653 family protein [Actinomycetes bacterium]